MNKQLALITPIGQYHQSEEQRIREQYALISDRFPEVETIALVHSGGPSEVRNLAAAKATADWLLFVDADVTIPTESIQYILNEISNSPHMLAGQIRVRTKTVKGHFYGLNQFLKKYKRINENSLLNQGAYFPAIDGACFLIKRDIFIKAGCFNHELNWNEDIDLTHRLLDFPGTIKIIPDAYCDEIFYQPSPFHFMARYYRSGRGMILFNAHYFNRSRLKNLYQTLDGLRRTCSSNLAHSESTEEKLFILLLRFLQFVGMIFHFMRPSHLGLNKALDSKAVVELDDNFFIKRNGQWINLKK